MNQQERDLIAQFVARVGGAQQNAQPGTALSPLDPEADQWIKDNFSKYPEAAYRVTQMAVVQEVALVEAQNRIRQLQLQVQQAQQQAQQNAQDNRPGGFLSGLFGGNRAQAQQGAGVPPGWGGQPQPGPAMPQNMPNAGYGPQANYPPGYNAGMFPARGSGFLGSALTTASGVAGGMLAANALTGLFSGHHFGADPSAGGLAGGASDGFGNMGQDPFAGAGIDAGNDFDADHYGNGDTNPSWGGDDSGDWGGDGGGYDDSF